MGASEKTAILVISFGTSYEETRKKTIEQIEQDLHHAYPEYPLYRAWTSRRIRAKLLKQDGIHIMIIFFKISIDARNMSHDIQAPCIMTIIFSFSSPYSYKRILPYTLPYSLSFVS